MMCYSPDFTKLTAAERQTEITAQQRVLEGCTDLGVTFCRVLSGQRRPGLDTDAALGWVAECIHALLPFAQSLGITLVLENHYKDGFWDYPEFAQRQDLFLRLVQAIGPHPAFGVNYDPSNAIVAGDDPIELLEAVKDRVVSMHASDRYLKSGTLADLRQTDATAGQGYSGILEHGVIGQGLNDYDRIFTILKSAGFTGWISIEDGADPVGGFDRLDESAQFLRAKMREHGLT
jgi:sugar phosphate isomerase/epimerase